MTPAMQAQAATAAKRVLVVEDELMIRMLLEDMLGELGYTVAAEAAHLDEALEATRSADFDLAILATEGGGVAHDPEKLRKGVELVYAKLVDALRAEGLERIEAEGKPFDPNEHEALMQTGDGDGEPVVAEVFREGYRLRGKVLRPAQVRVTRG